jgi:hypothetical protein
MPDQRKRIDTRINDDDNDTGITFAFGWEITGIWIVEGIYSFSGTTNKLK